MNAVSVTQVARLRTALATLVVSGVMVGSLGVALEASGARTVRLAGVSPFCKTLMSFASVKGAPSAKNLAAYRKWVTTNLPRFQKLEAEAPNASVKKALGQLVTMLQSETNVTDLRKLERSIAANRQLWANDFKVFISTSLSCVMNPSNLY